MVRCQLSLPSLADDLGFPFGGAAPPPHRKPSLPLLYSPLFPFCFSLFRFLPSAFPTLLDLPRRYLGAATSGLRHADLYLCTLLAPTVFSIVGWKWVCLTAIGGAVAYGGGFFHTLMFVGSDLDLAVTVVGSLIRSLSWRSFSCRFCLVAAVIPIWNFRWLMPIAVGLDGGGR